MLEQRYINVTIMIMISLWLKNCVECWKQNKKENIKMLKQLHGRITQDMSWYNFITVTFGRPSLGHDGDFNDPSVVYKPEWRLWFAVYVTTNTRLLCVTACRPAQGHRDPVLVELEMDLIYLIIIIFNDPGELVTLWRVGAV